MSLNSAQPIFNPTTRYQIEVQGQVDGEWLQSFDSSLEMIADEPGQVDGISVLNVYTDQAGFVGLVRRLHGLGMTILRFQIVTRKEE